MTEPASEFTDGDVFTYLNVQNQIVVWIRIGGSWASSDRGRAEDGHVRDAMGAEPIEEHIGDGRIKRTLRGGSQTGDMITWTLVTGAGLASAVSEQPLADEPKDP